MESEVILPLSQVFSPEVLLPSEDSPRKSLHEDGSGIWKHCFFGSEFDLKSTKEVFYICCFCHIFCIVFTSLFFSAFPNSPVRVRAGWCSPQLNPTLEPPGEAGPIIAIQPVSHWWTFWRAPRSRGSRQYLGTGCPLATTQEHWVIRRYIEAWHDERWAHDGCLGMLITIRATSFSPLHFTQWGWFGFSSIIKLLVVSVRQLLLVRDLRECFDRLPGGGLIWPNALYEQVKPGALFSRSYIYMGSLGSPL